LKLDLLTGCFLQRWHHLREIFFGFFNQEGLSFHVRDRVVQSKELDLIVADECTEIGLCQELLLLNHPAGEEGVESL